MEIHQIVVRKMIRTIRTKINKWHSQDPHIFNSAYNFLVADGSIIFAARLIDSLSGFLLSILIVRYYGLKGSGTYSIASIPVTFYALLGTLGLPNTFARSSVNIEKLNTIGAVLAMAIIPLSIPFSYLYALSIGSDKEEIQTIVLFSFGGIFFAHLRILNALQILQKRIWDILIVSSMNLLGTLIVVFFKESLIEFGVVLTVFRFLGTFYTFSVLPKEFVTIKEMYHKLKTSIVYVVSDSINLLADQVPLFISSYLISREEMGLYGLCRQVVTFSQTPIWSTMTLAYPSVVKDPIKSLSQYPEHMFKFGALTGLVGLLVSILLGTLIFHSNEFIYLSIILMIVNPYRYILYFYDIYLKAIGATHFMNLATFLRLISGLLLLPFSLWMWGVYGGVLASVIITISSVYIVREFAHSR